MSNRKYKFSFTAAGSLIAETLTIARYQYQCKDWVITKREVIEQNLLLKDKKATALRQYSEIELRLKTLTKNEIILLCTGSMEDVKAMIWLSIIKTYSFIEDLFTSTVLVNYKDHKPFISDGDYVLFWESVKNTSNEIQSLSDSSTKKIKQVVFKMLFDLGFIDSTKTRRITRPSLTVATEITLAQDSPNLLKLFLYEQLEIKQIINKL